MKVKETLSKINLPARASMAYLGASLIGKFIGIMTTPFFTRMIGQEEYGELTLYLTILGGASIVCSAFSSSSAVYRGFRLYEDRKSDFIKSSITVSLSFSLIICTLLFTLSSFLELKSSLYLPLSLQIICDSIVGFSLAKARYQYRYGQVMAINLLTSALPSLISLILLSKFSFGFSVRIFSMLFLSILIAGLQLFRLLKANGRIKTDIIKNVIKSSLPLLPHSISIATIGQVDKLFITSLMGAAALASYSVAHSLGISLQFLVTTLGSAIAPWLIRRMDERNYSKIGDVISTVFSLFCATVIALCVISPEIMNILAPREYFSSLPAIIPIALSVPLNFISYIASVGLVQIGKGKHTAISSLMSLIASVIMSYLLIPSFGYFGAGLAILLSQAVSSLLGVIFLFRITEESFIPIKKICLIYSVCALICFTIMPFYSFLYIRILILIIPAVLGLKSLLHSKQLITE